MEQKQCWHGNKEVLHILNTLPRKILSMHDTHNLVEFIMHELCNDHCFNIKKAAYIIDNPDFDFMRGITGFNHQERYNKGNIWASPEDFTTHMNNALFNQKVRSLHMTSGRRRNENRDTFIKNVADTLGFERFGCCDIPMKHDNHGIFLFEGSLDNENEHESLLNGVSLLSFCPIY